MVPTRIAFVVTALLVAASGTVEANGIRHLLNYGDEYKAPINGEEDGYRPPINGQNGEDEYRPPINGQQREEPRRHGKSRGNNGGVGQHGNNGGVGQQREEPRGHGGNGGVVNDPLDVTEEDPLDDTCKLSNWSKPICTCQSFLIEYRTVLDKENSWECDTLVKSLVRHKKKIACKKKHNDCAAIAYNVAHDTLNHVQAIDHYDNAARVYRLAGGRGNSRTIISVLSEGKTKLETKYANIESHEGEDIESVKKHLLDSVQAYFKKALPNARVDQIMKGMHSEFENLFHQQMEQINQKYENGEVDANVGNEPVDEEGGRPDVGNEEFDQQNQGIDVGNEEFQDVVRDQQNQEEPGFAGDQGGNNFDNGGNGGFDNGRIEPFEENKPEEPFEGDEQAFRQPNNLPNLHDKRHVDEEMEMPDGEFEGVEAENRFENHNPENFVQPHHNPKPVVIEEEYGNEEGVFDESEIGIEPVDIPHNHHREVSKHPKTTRGDMFLFVIALAMLIGVSVLAMTSQFSSPWLVLGASTIDFWVMTTFYWIDVRTPYNIDHYEHAGMIYDAFAITCVIVVLFAAVRAASALNQMIESQYRRKKFPKLDILAAMGLLAQLTVLCIHVITTTHASRTVIAGFIGTILSTVIQTWHLIHQNKFGDELPMNRASRFNNSKNFRTAKRVLNFNKKNQAKHV